MALTPAGLLAESTDPAAEQAGSASTAATSSEGASTEKKLEIAINEISSLEGQVKEAAELYLKSEGDERERSWAKLNKLQTAIDTELDKIVKYFLEMKEKGLDTPALKSDVEKILTGDQKFLSRQVEELGTRLEDLSKEMKNAGPKEKVRILQSAQESTKSVGMIFNVMLSNAKRKEAVGIDASKDLEQLDASLIKSANEFSSHLALIDKQRDAAQRAYNKAGEAEKEALKSQLDDVKERHNLLTKSLTKIVEMMKRRGLDVSEYSKLLITSTGRITQDIFEEGVAASLFSEWLEQAWEWIMENGASLVFQFIIIVLILIAFRFLAMLASKVITRGLDQSKLQVSHLFREFAISTSRKAVMLLGLLVALSQMGVDVAPMLAGLGVAGFVIGFALKDTLSNFASGMMILIYRPFDIGDAVEVDGVVGKVQAMTLVSTTVLTFDNQQLMIPNNNIWGNTIKNITARTTRRVDMTFGISYRDDIAEAESILWRIVKTHPLVLSEPEPIIKLSALGASSVDFIVRPWSKTTDYWDVYWDITRSVKLEFDKAGVSIPYQQSDVHLYRHDIEIGNAK